MVAHRRIDPDGGLLREIIDVRRRVQHVETRPSGVIATREMFIVTDPETGVQTIMGTLPDGSTGFQPFVGDIVPPPVATAPTATAQPGTITVSWDGTFVAGAEQPADFEHLNVIGHKIVTGTTVLSLEVGSIRLANESVIVNTDIISYGEQWQFSFESEDYNGNISVRSDRTPLIDVISFVDDSLVGEALSALEADVVAAQQASTDAQIAADAAQDSADAVAMNLSSTSAEVTAAQLKADQAFNLATDAATDAGNAQTSADGKNKNWYQDTAPAGTGHAIGDTWFDTNADNAISRWDGDSWEPALIGNSAIMSNLDAGKMSVGTLQAGRIGAKSIGVDKLTITSTDNLIVGGDMALSAASWPKTANITAQPTAGRGSMPALRFSGLAGAMASVNSSNRVTVEPDNRFRCSISVKSSSALAVDRVRLMIRCFTSPTTSSDVIGVYNTAPLVANTWTQIKGVSYALPANTREVEFYLYVTNPDTTTTTDIDYVAVTRAADGSLIVDGSVTATKLESDLILATKIVAGDPNGTHAEMSPQGFRVYADAAEVGAPSTEVVRLGVANTNDYFAVTKSDGTLAASISQEGVIAGSQVNANSSLYYKGTELTTILKRLPKGNVAYSAYGGINVNNINTNTGIGLFDLGFNAEAGRAYRISGYIRGYLTGGNGQITTQLKYTSGGAAPTINSASLTVDGHSALSDHWNTYYFNKFVHFNAAGGPDAWVRVLLVAGREVGPGVFNVFDSLMSIDDIGLQFNPTGTPNTGGGTTAPAKTNYIKQYGCYNSMNYQGNNSQYNFDTGRMYQGLSPAGYGNLKSIGLFPDMTADLSGASINYIRVYFNFAHWYYNSGGTARIGLHGHTGIPGSFSQAGNIITSTGWPKPGARWLDIDSIHWDNFKTGAYRGVTLEGDGSYVTYGYADRPTIEINYTK